jgi:hypothetical protein
MLCGSTGSHRVKNRRTYLYKRTVGAGMRCRHRGVVTARALLPSVRKRPTLHVNVVESGEESREGAARRSESIKWIRRF